MKLQTSFNNPFVRSKSGIMPILVGGITALFIFLMSLFFLRPHSTKPSAHQIPMMSMPQDTVLPAVVVSDTLCTFIVPHDVKMKHYFAFMDSLRRVFDTLPYELSEHILVRINPFIIDTLENTDYYRMKLRDSFVYDQKQLVILKKGDTLKIPTLAVVDTLKAKMARTYIDVNIPEFKLRIIEDMDTIYTFPVRVGQNRTRFLMEVGREVDLRTRTGVGYISYIHKKDFFIDPVEGKKFTSTKRDDNRRTLMPLQPWLEPKIYGQLWGQLIHPTTNPSSLGKAYSNGCIGTKEADIWRLYYYAPVGTKVKIRYDLRVINEQGDTLRLKHIYNSKKMIFS